MRGGKKDPPIKFFPKTSTNVGIISQNFLNFSFDLFNKLV